MQLFLLDIVLDWSLRINKMCGNYLKGHNNESHGAAADTPRTKNDTRVEVGGVGRGAKQQLQAQQEKLLFFKCTCAAFLSELTHFIVGKRP